MLGAMQIRQKGYDVGSLVRVRHVNGGYQLPRNLPEGAMVTVRQVQPGWRVVEWDGKLYGIPMACIDPGWMPLSPHRPASRTPSS